MLIKFIKETGAVFGRDSDEMAWQLFQKAKRYSGATVRAGDMTFRYKDARVLTTALIHQADLLCGDKKFRNKVEKLANEVYVQFFTPNRYGAPLPP